MLQKFPYQYRGLTLSQIEARLYGQILDALRDKYGPAPDPLIVTRVREEWEAIRRGNAVAETAFLHEFTQWLSSAQLPWLLSGSGGTSLILHLLGIACGNPLPAHLYCPCCRRVIWMPEQTDGFDIPAGQHLCSEDGTVMVGDGHGLPWELLWELEAGDDSPIWIQIPLQVFRLLPELLEEHWLKAVKPAQPKLSRWDDVLSLHCHICFRACLDPDELNEGTCHPLAEANDLNKAQRVLEQEIARLQKFVEEELEIPRPERFSEIVRQLAEENPVWEVQFLEDAYFDLLRMGCPREDALGILNAPSAPLSRAHTIEYLILRIRMMGSQRTRSIDPE